MGGSAHGVCLRETDELLQQLRLLRILAVSQ